MDEPLATEGARLFGGRWNPKGYPLLYTTSSPALALLESFVHQPHVQFEKLPRLFLFTLEIPVLDAPGDASPGVSKTGTVTTYPADQLPDYRNYESYERTQWLLHDWLNNPRTLVAAVPSVVVPMSHNYLIHPAHPGFEQIRVMGQETFPIEKRLWAI